MEAGTVHISLQPDQFLHRRSAHSQSPSILSVKSRGLTLGVSRVKGLNLVSKESARTWRGVSSAFWNTRCAGIESREIVHTTACRVSSLSSSIFFPALADFLPLPAPLAAGLLDFGPAMMTLSRATPPLWLAQQHSTALDGCAQIGTPEDKNRTFPGVSSCAGGLSVGSWAREIKFLFVVSLSLCNIL